MEDICAETKRLIIRPLTMEDYDAFVAGYRDSASPKNRFDEGNLDTSYMTRRWYEKLLERRKSEAERDWSYVLNIFRKSDGVSLGHCDVTPHRREAYQYGRIGYTLHNPYWGMGYGTETVKALIKIGFEDLNLHRLEAHVNLDNFASKRVLHKAGMMFECVRKGLVLESGTWTDNEVYYIGNDNWKPRKP